MKYIVAILLPFQVIASGLVFDDAKEYAADFETLTNQKILSRVDMGSLSEDTLGVCWTKWKNITINKKTWGPLSSIERKALIFHELSHCDHYLEHDDSMRPDECPVSLMHSYLPSKRCLNTHWYSYIKDLTDKMRGKK